MGSVDQPSRNDESRMSCEGHSDIRLNTRTNHRMSRELGIGSTSITDVMDFDDEGSRKHNRGSNETTKTESQQPVTLQQVIESFSEWKQPTTKTCPFSLPPFSNDLPVEDVKTQRMSEREPQEVQNMALDDRESGSKVYVMPSGYIVQSVQLVLHRAKAAKEIDVQPCLVPTFTPVAYTYKHLSNHIPVWEASVSPMLHCGVIPIDIRVKVVVTDPITELFDESRCPPDIDAKSFLSKLNSEGPGCSAATQEPTKDALVHETRVLLRELMQHSVEDGSFVSDRELSPKAPKTEIDRLLEKFSQRIDNLYPTTA